MADPERQDRPPAQPSSFSPPPTETGTGAAAAQLATQAAPPAVAAAALAVTAKSTLQNAVEALGVFFQSARIRNNEWLRATMKAAAPADVAQAIAEETVRQQAYEEKAKIRFRAAMIDALGKGAAAERAAGVRKATAAERRYATMRQEMVAARSVAAVDRVGLRQLSPQGAFWKLGQRATHTPDCVALSGKVWPWEALDRFRMWPPLHGNCGCTLHSYMFAVAQGWLRPGATMDVETAIRRLVVIQQMREGEETLLPMAEALAEQGLVTLENFSRHLAQLVEETT